PALTMTVSKDGISLFPYYKLKTMKTLSPLLALVLFLTFICESNSQTSAISSSAGQDYIIDKQQDTLKAIFVFPSRDIMPFGDTVWMQQRVIVLKNGNLVEFFPKDLQGFCYKGSYYESILLNKNTTQPATIARKFCKRIVNGAIQIYAFNTIVNDEEGYSRVMVDLYYKNDHRFPETMALDNTVAQLISGCPPLSKKIKQYGFSLENSLAIIRRYNTLLEPKTSH
ncbi:MAG: hypothetical protein WD824_25200, partial [Cyclobacteriaceae bacterium]